MRLESEGAAPLAAPTAEQVVACVQRIQHADSGFAILAQRADTYMQAAVDPDGGFLLEYQDGGLDRHYRAPGSVPLEQVIGAFQSYLQQNGAWRSMVAWERVDARPRPAPPRPHRELRRMPAGRVLARLGIGLGWFVVQALILAACFVAGGELGGLGYLVSPDYYAAPLAVGFIAGIVIGLWLNVHIPRWLFQQRVRHLRRAGVRTAASLDWVDQQMASSRGTALRTYTVFVSWPAADGQTHRLERQYRFWGSGWRQFEAAVAGATVPVLYEPARPAHAVLDVPFTPTVADLLL